jgi:hypothetical protein
MKPPSRRLCCLAREPGRRFLLVFVSLPVFLAACSGSSPRFRSEERESVHIVQEEGEFRFASRIREEEAKEDDRKVDLGAFRNSVESKSPQGRYHNVTPGGINRDAVLLEVVSLLGAPYRYGGNGKDGIDCSGFTQSVFRSSLNRALPRTARDQYREGEPVSGQELQFGDLVFFNTTGGGPSHVGIYLEDDLFAHASVTYGVTISSLESTYYRKRFLGVRRLVR